MTSNMQSRHITGSTLEIDANRMLVTSVILAASPDRQGQVVKPQGLQNYDEFMENPVVLWAHQRTRFPPIGVCEVLDIQPEGIIARTKFAKGISIAEDIFKLYQQGILKGWSIGFVAHPQPATTYSTYMNRDNDKCVEKWSLLEYSAVPIPEHPQAITIECSN